MKQLYTVTFRDPDGDYCTTSFVDDGNSGHRLKTAFLRAKTYTGCTQTWEEYQDNPDECFTDLDWDSHLTTFDPNDDEAYRVVLVKLPLADINPLPPTD